MAQEQFGVQHLQPELVLQAIEDEVAQLQVEQGLQAEENKVNKQNVQTENKGTQKLKVDQGSQTMEEELDQELQEENIVGQEIQVEQGLQAVENEVDEQGVQTENEGEQQLQVDQGSQTVDDELEQELFCAICNDITNNNDIRLCECNYKIHHECLKMTLLSWKKSLLHNFTGLQCVRCNTVTKIKLQPHKSVLVEDMEKVARKYRWLCKKLVKYGKVIVVHQVLTTHGLTVLHQIYGREKAIEIANSLGPINSVLLCQSIPLIALGISFSHWEEKLLIVLRRCSRVPVVGRLFPQEHPGVVEPVNRARTWLTAAVDGLLLPWYGGACGLLLCGFSESGLRRLILGTSAFLSVRALLYMYCRQRRYNYLGNRTVANYENW